MASGSKVEIIIDKKGGVEIKATGFKGQACEQATREIEEALGTVFWRKKTPEAYLTDKTGAKQSLQR